MFAGFVRRVQFVAERGQVVARIGILWIEAHGEAQMLTRFLEQAEIVQRAA